MKPATGMIRYNEEKDFFECYDGTKWGVPFYLTTIEPMNNNLDDLLYFQNKIMESIAVPASYMLVPGDNITINVPKAHVGTTFTITNTTNQSITIPPIGIKACGEGQLISLNSIEERILWEKRTKISLCKTCGETHRVEDLPATAYDRAMEIVK